MQHVHHMLNPWAIGVCAVFLWMLGALWYSPVLFAKPWIAIVGRKEGEKPKGVAKGMVGSLIGDVLLAMALSHFVIWSGADSFGWGALIGFIAWLGFFAAVNYPQSVYEGRPLKYFFINNCYWLIGLLVVGGVLAIWR